MTSSKSSTDLFLYKEKMECIHKYLQELATYFDNVTTYNQPVVITPMEASYIMILIEAASQQCIVDD